MSLRLELLDSAFTCSGPAGLLDELQGLFPAAPASPVVEHVLDVRGDAAVLDDEPVPGLGPERLLEAVLTAVNAAVIADVRTFSVHAGVVARDGAWIAWPGVSGAGKSTLTAACLQAGFAYVSDEALALVDGRARVYPKPVSLSAWSLAALGLPGVQEGALERPVPVPELGDLAPSTSEPGHLVLLDRRPGPASLAPASSGQLARLLLEHSFNHYKDPALAFREATAVAAAASCWTLSYDRPQDGAEALRGL